MSATGRRASFASTDATVQVQDCGGTGKGRTIVLLTGLGDNAHVNDQFAIQFTGEFTSSGSLAALSIDARGCTLTPARIHTVIPPYEDQHEN
jgi:hypothetical protein